MQRRPRYQRSREGLGRQRRPRHRRSREVLGRQRRLQFQRSREVLLGASRLFGSTQRRTPRLSQPYRLNLPLRSSRVPQQPSQILAQLSFRFSRLFPSIPFRRVRVLALI